MLFFTNKLIAQRNLLDTAQRMLKTPQVFEQKLLAVLPAREIFRCPQPIKVSLLITCPQVYADSVWFTWQLDKRLTPKKSPVFSVYLKNLFDEISYQKHDFTTQSFVIQRSWLPQDEENTIVVVRWQEEKSCEEALITWASQKKKAVMQKDIAAIRLANQNVENELFYLALAVYFMEKKYFIDMRHCLRRAAEVAPPNTQKSYLTLQGIYEKLIF